MRIASLLCCMALAAAECRAADVFVDNVLGNDLSNGTQPEPAGRVGGPVRSLARALAICRAGDRIVLANTKRPYYESVTLCTGRHCGNVLGPFIIEGNGAILDGSAPIPPRSWAHYEDDIYRLRRDRKGPYHMLFLDGVPMTRATGAAVRNGPPDLNELEWYASGAYVYLRVEKGKLPEAYPLSQSVEDAGVGLFHVHDVVIRDLVVQGFRLDGANAKDGVNNCLLTGLNCRGNGRAGIAVEGSSRVNIESCLIGNNATAQLLVDGHTITDVRDTELLAATAPPALRRSETARLSIEKLPSNESSENAQIEPRRHATRPPALRAAALSVGGVLLARRLCLP